MSQRRTGDNVVRESRVHNPNYPREDWRKLLEVAGPEQALRCDEDPKSTEKLYAMAEKPFPADLHIVEYRSWVATFFLPCHTPALLLFFDAPQACILCSRQ